MASSAKIGVFLLAILLGWIVLYYQLVAPAMEKPAPLPGLELTANDTIGNTPTGSIDGDGGDKILDPHPTVAATGFAQADDAVEHESADGDLPNAEIDTPAAPKLPTSIPPPPVTTPYVVKQNDTMQTIARDWFGSVTKWVLIAQENPLADPMKLRRGQILRLPEKAARPENIPPELYAELTREINYVISPGDTLSGIAQQFYGKSNLYPVIFKANRAVIRNPDSLVAGTEIVIPRYQQPAD